MTLCRRCRKPVPPNEAAAYQDRCEECWTLGQPGGTPSPVSETVKFMKTRRPGFDFNGDVPRQAKRIIAVF